MNKNNTNPEIPSNVPDVQDLRKMGHKVRVIEHRYFYDFSSFSMSDKLFGSANYYPKRRTCNKGGEQIVEITLKTGEELRGIATCSIKENFNRKYGRRLAIYRALKDSNYTF